jgi:hypothetical protein
VFLLEDPILESAQHCSLNPPLDPQAAGLSIEGRAVPDYGAPFEFLVAAEFPVPAFLAAPASRSARYKRGRHFFQFRKESPRDAGATQTSRSVCNNFCKKLRSPHSSDSRNPWPAICCRMLNVYGNIPELSSLRWLRSSGVA